MWTSCRAADQHGLFIFQNRLGYPPLNQGWRLPMAITLQRSPLAGLGQGKSRTKVLLHLYQHGCSLEVAEKVMLISLGVLARRGKNPTAADRPTVHTSR